VKPVIEDFKLGKVIGLGNFCRVLHAEFRSSGRSYALKIIDKSVLRKHCLRSPNTPLLLLQEKFVGTRVGSSMGVRLHCSFQDSSSVYFVYDYAVGGELWRSCMGKLLGDQCEHPIFLDEGAARVISSWLVDALIRLHGMGVAHRDLKPENLLLLQLEGEKKECSASILLSPIRPALTDWGTAKVLFPACDTKYNHPAQCVGTLEYMAPEAADNEGAGGGLPTDARADLWSLGCTIGRIMNGVSPFCAPSPYLASRRSLCHDVPGHCNEPSSSSSSFSRHSKWDGLLFPPGLPAQCEGLIRGLLKRDPSSRINGPALRLHPWFTQRDSVTPVGVVSVPSLKHLALLTLAHRIANFPALSLPELFWAMGGGEGGGGGEKDHGSRAAFSRTWRCLWLQIMSPTFPHTLRLRLFHVLCLTRRSSVPHIVALFCATLGQARYGRALGLGGGSGESPLQLGLHSPREMLGWLVSPEAIVSREEIELFYAGGGVGAKAKGGIGVEEGVWRRVLGEESRGSSAEASCGSDLSRETYALVIGAVWRFGEREGSSDCDSGDCMGKNLIAFINRLSPPPRALIFVGPSPPFEILEALSSLSSPTTLVFVSGGDPKFYIPHKPITQGALPGGGRTDGELERDAGSHCCAWLGDGIRLLAYSSPDAHGIPHRPLAPDPSPEKLSPAFIGALEVAGVCARHTILTPGYVPSFRPRSGDGSFYSGGSTAACSNSEDDESISAASAFRSAWESLAEEAFARGEKGGGCRNLRYALSPCPLVKTPSFPGGTFSRECGKVQSNDAEGWRPCSSETVDQEAGGLRILRVPDLNKSLGLQSSSPSLMCSNSSPLATFLGLRFSRESVTPGWIVGDFKSERSIHISLE